MTEKEILEQLYKAEQLAQKKKSQRGKMIYAFFAVVAFMLSLKIGGNGVVDSLIIGILGGGFFMYIFLVFLSVLSLVSEVEISLPEDKSVNYWKEKLHKVRGEDYYRNFFNK